MKSSHAHVDQMIFAAVEALAPEVAGRCREQLNSNDPLAVPSKPVILDALLKAHGPKPLLDVAFHFPERAPGSLLLFFLVCSASPAILISKLSRYDRYFHPYRRLEIREEKPNELLVENFSRREPALPIDDLFVCSVLKALLLKIGAVGLSIEWHTCGSTALRELLAELGIVPHTEGRHTQWRIKWKKMEHPDLRPGLDELFLSMVSLASDQDVRPLTCSVERLLRSRLHKRPSMAEIAIELNISQRSLTRGLNKEATSFSRILAGLRIQVAERLMQTTTLSLKEIGYLAGFTDSAHFTREFKSVRKLTPGAYRDSLRLHDSEPVERTDALVT